MPLKSLLRVDLNLLFSLHILLQERNVSRAAERLFITQPAMSKTLSRLRATFDDPLFTRSSHGMQPTPRALELELPLQSILQDIAHLIEGEAFDPAHYRGELTLALSEYIGIWLLPRLMARLQTSAPGLTVRSITRVEHQLEQLAEGALDFAIHVAHSHYGEEFIRHSLGSNPAVVLARQGHPLSGQRVDWDSIRNYPTIRLYIADLAELEVFKDQSEFAQQVESQEANSRLETSHLLTALEVLRQTDYLMPAPPFLLSNPTAAYGIQALPTPPELDIRIEHVLVRHRRSSNSPIHNWLWQEILAVLDELREGSAQPRDSVA